MTDKSTVVGFDFGTTNSLISVVVGDRAIHIMDPVNGLPFPSVVRYEGERSVVGREAKELLDSAGLGIHGSTVRSPKVLLGEDSVHVGCLERNPVDIVRDVVKHVKTQALASPRASVLEGVARAVVTIPVRMNGVKRRALRNAFTLADIRIVQFVHEPLAALYGYFRSHPDMDSLIREYDRRNIVVVDWGGGTLDLTLCRLVNRGILQIRNAGTDEVGGDKFDEAIRNGVIKRFMEAHAIPGDMEVYPDARIRLLHDSEMHKIALSTRSSVTFYRQGFFKAEDDTLEYTLTRAELEEITRTLVRRGLNEIENLLSTAGIGPSQVGMCLVAGGMAGMPAIIGRIHELFGPQRVVVARGTGTLVAEGSAWIAHDGQPLRLSKAIELQLARGAYFPLLPANTAMPTERQVKSRQFHLWGVFI